MKNYSRVCARIDLDAIEYNMEMMRRNLDDEETTVRESFRTQVHFRLSAYSLNRFILSSFRGMILRSGGIDKPILVMGCIFPEQWEEMLDNEIHMTVYHLDIIADPEPLRYNFLSPP